MKKKKRELSIISDTQVRIKMYKAGKNWVSVIISKYKIIKHVGQRLILQKKIHR